MIKSILRRDTDNENAKILMAFCCIHYLMSKSDLEYAEKILKEVIKNGKKEKGAAYKLLAEVLKDLGKLSTEEEIKYLKLSVKFEPNWVFNHHVLSKAYEKEGNFQKAIEHMNIAIKNLVDETSNWSISQYYYESIITGRVSVRNYLEMDLKEMIKKLNKKKKKWSFIKRKKRRKPGMTNDGVKSCIATFSLQKCINARLDPLDCLILVKERENILLKLKKKKALNPNR